MRRKAGHGFDDRDGKRFRQRVKKAAAAAVSEQLQNVVARTSDYVVSFDAVDTGALLNSIYARAGNGKTSGPVDGLNYGQPPPEPKDQFSGFAACGVFYGIFVHEGYGALRRSGSTDDRASGATAMRISDRAAVTWVPGRPFLMLAVRDVDQKWAAIFARHMKGVQR